MLHLRKLRNNETETRDSRWEIGIIKTRSNIVTDASSHMNTEHQAWLMLWNGKLPSKDQLSTYPAKFDLISIFKGKWHLEGIA